MKRLEIYAMRNTLVKLFSMNFDVSISIFLSQYVNEFYEIMKDIEKKQQEIQKNKEQNGVMDIYMNEEVSFQMELKEEWILGTKEKLSPIDLAYLKKFMGGEKDNEEKN